MSVLPPPNTHTATAKAIANEAKTQSRVQEPRAPHPTQSTVEPMAVTAFGTSMSASGTADTYLRAHMGMHIGMARAYGNAYRYGARTQGTHIGTAHTGKHIGTRAHNAYPHGARAGNACRHGAHTGNAHQQGRAHRECISTRRADRECTSARRAGKDAYRHGAHTGNAYRHGRAAHMQTGVMTTTRA